MFRVRGVILFALVAFMVGNCHTFADDHLFRLPEVGSESTACTFPPRECGDGCSSPHCQGGCCPYVFDWEFLARGYYQNDRRVQWSGQEATFGAEGVLTSRIAQKFDRWDTQVLGEFYLNQPFDRNILVDTPERRSYAGNFDVEPFEISQLLLSFRNGNLELSIGKMVTPFGRTYFPLYTNARIDAPFIRTECILWRETGVLIRYDPDVFVGEIAITNGCEDRDTNSSKALISRLGIETDRFAVGFSVKVQDGIGSERQKRINNHVGVDFMVRWGYFTFSGEAIYDEYGFRQPGFDPDNITWGRSIYYRDQNYQIFKPITGVGYYLNLGFEKGPWCITLNFGEFYPQELGDPRHDVVNQRGIVKTAYYMTPYLQAYAVLMTETEGYMAQGSRPRLGSFVLAGFEYVF
jgi:hypothetical protein